MFVVMGLLTFMKSIAHRTVVNNHHFAEVRFH